MKITGSRPRLNIISAHSVNDLSRTMTRDYPQINADAICRFFVAVRQTSQVKDWASVMNIELHHLPPYSPNLNPTERLRKVMNEHVRNNRYFASAKAFRNAMKGFFEQALPGLAEKLRFLINDNLQLFISEF